MKNSTDYLQNQQQKPPIRGYTDIQPQQQNPNNQQNGPSQPDFDRRYQDQGGFQGRYNIPAQDAAQERNPRILGSYNLNPQSANDYRSNPYATEVQRPNYPPRDPYAAEVQRPATEVQGPNQPPLQPYADEIQRPNQPPRDPYSGEVQKPKYPLRDPYLGEVQRPNYPTRDPYAPEVQRPNYPPRDPYAPEVQRPNYPLQHPYASEVHRPNYDYARQPDDIYSQQQRQQFTGKYFDDTMRKNHSEQQAQHHMTNHQGLQRGQGYPNQRSEQQFPTQSRLTLEREYYDRGDRLEPELNRYDQTYKDFQNRRFTGYDRQPPMQQPMQYDRQQPLQQDRQPPLQQDRQLPLQKGYPNQPNQRNMSAYDRQPPLQSVQSDSALKKVQFQGDIKPEQSRQYPTQSYNQTDQIVSQTRQEIDYPTRQSYQDYQNRRPDQLRGYEFSNQYPEYDRQNPSQSQQIDPSREYPIRGDLQRSLIDNRRRPFTSATKSNYKREDRYADELHQLNNHFEQAPPYDQRAQHQDVRGQHRQSLGQIQNPPSREEYKGQGQENRYRRITDKGIPPPNYPMREEYKGQGQENRYRGITEKENPRDNRQHFEDLELNLQDLKGKYFAPDRYKQQFQ